MKKGAAYIFLKVKVGKEFFMYDELNMIGDFMGDLKEEPLPGIGQEESGHW